MKALIFTPDRNLGDRKDYTGAFRPEARAFAALHTAPLARVVAVNVGQTATDQREQVEDAIASAGPLELVAWFCHGFRNGLQLGHRLAHVDRLARAIAANATTSVRVALYACSTGASLGNGAAGDGGFADALRDALCRAGATQCQVDAHDTAAHATRNPRVRRFRGDGSPVGGTGGGWIVAPGSELWGPWRRALQQTDLRLRFPTMTVADVHAELLARRAVA